jgi:hypothetical protein
MPFPGPASAPFSGLKKPKNSLYIAQFTSLTKNRKQTEKTGKIRP